MTQDTALEMKDVELNEFDQEKVPMAAGVEDALVGSGGEKNGVVKVKLEDDDAVGDTRAQKFTGLSKEELLRVAGTPGWVKVRWVLLILFWLGWAGMLAGAVVIIVQAPRCQPLPVLEWWHKGPLYQLGNPETFQDSNGDGIGDIKGIQQRLESLSSLKVKGLVIGPLHVNQPDDNTQTYLTEIDQRYGNFQDFLDLLEAARKKSIKLIIDLSPNYRGNNIWFENTLTSEKAFQDKIKDAMEFWLKQCIGGIYFGGIENLDNLSELFEEWKNITANSSSECENRALLVSTNEHLDDNVLTLLNTTGSGLLSSRYLLSKENASKESLGERINQYINTDAEQWNSWAVGGPQVGHMASLVKEKLLRAYQLLLFTLPGTPVMFYGDEIGLKDQPEASPYMRWDDTENGGFSTDVKRGDFDNRTISFKAQEEDKKSLLSTYKSLSELRGKERSLLHGDFVSLVVNTQSLAYLRKWDQNERFISALNFDLSEKVTMTLKGHDLPEQGSVVLSSDPERKEGSTISLTNLMLGPGEALLIKYPYNS
ncbi:4F2 cell-surface antigen heavy chain isoform X2 [Bombina bombina]|uniref:4F2 cell-surface antigen heavy chain isoform X2 n=1 Tax=Bombina bombina TaxID=8345 RepID=UPI00235A82D5|nr:4F2 cell-surface antigen heavy chain isoform X2 [Bombina bombina]